MTGINKDFNLSYWEKKEYFTDYDLVVIGCGIVGLSAAIAFSEKNKKARILILEKGLLPDGASTKNAGFACFGSAGELAADIRRSGEDSVWQIVEMRWRGLQLLRKRVGDRHMDYRAYGGYELFYQDGEYEAAVQELDELNSGMKKLLGLRQCYRAIKKAPGLTGYRGVIFNPYEGQIDTGMMMRNLIRLASARGILILNNVNVKAISENHGNVQIVSSMGVFTAARVIVATNGFASQLIRVDDLKPARAQVLVTKPIPGLKIRGTFHFDEGFYYFRNINDRILFGGGRNLDLTTETTARNGLNNKIQKQLEVFLKERILGGQNAEIEQRWTGIMGVGREKKPIIRMVGKRVVAAVRMGGMGIAIGSWVGKEASMLASDI